MASLSLPPIACFGTTQVTTAFTGVSTRLKGTNIFVNSAFGSRFWYPDNNDRTINASTYYANLNPPGDVIVSIQSISGVLFPANISRLLPPSLIPTKRRSPAKPPPPKVTRKPPPPLSGKAGGLSLCIDCAVAVPCSDSTVTAQWRGMSVTATNCYTIERHEHLSGSFTLIVP